MNPIDAALLLAIAAILTSLGQILSAWYQKRQADRKLPGEVKKTEAEADTSTSAAADNIVNAASKAVDLYEKRNLSLAGENMELKQEVEAARAEMRAMRDEQKSIRDELRGLRAAFEFLCAEVEAEYPVAVRIAREKAGIVTAPPPPLAGDIGAAE